MENEKGKEKKSEEGPPVQSSGNYLTSKQVTRESHIQKTVTKQVIPN